MSDAAATLIATVALLAVAVLAAAVGSLRADVRALQQLRPELDAMRAERARDRQRARAALLRVRLAVRQIRRILGAPPPPDDGPDPVGFRMP